jgi:hypothetical protein
MAVMFDTHSNGTNEESRFQDVAPDVSKEPSTFWLFQTLKTKALYSFEMSGGNNPATRRYLPEDVRR